MTSPYRDPAKMSDSALMRECTRLRGEVDDMRASVRRAWSWAGMWVCILASIVIIQYMAMSECLSRVEHLSAKSCPICPTCDRSNEFEVAWANGKYVCAPKVRP